MRHRQGVVLHVFEAAVYPGHGDDFFSQWPVETLFGINAESAAHLLGTDDTAVETARVEVLLVELGEVTLAALRGEDVADGTPGQIYSGGDAVCTVDGGETHGEGCDGHGSADGGLVADDVEVVYDVDPFFLCDP